MEDNFLENVQMIKASNKARLTRTMILDTYKYEGLMGVYNLGMQHMLDYLTDKTNTNKESSSKKEELWSWNETDDELWSHGTFDSREDALQDALSNIDEIKSYLETDSPTIYIGKCEYIPLPTSIDSEQILWNLDEQYSEETNCEDYLYENTSEEHILWLEDKLSDVITEFHNRIGLKPTYWTVNAVEKVDLSEYEKK